MKKKQKMVIIVQARMGATRLPGKVMKTVLGKPLLWYLIDRLKRVSKADQVVIATTINPKDQIIADFCTLFHVPVFRGSEHDVLDRYYNAAKESNADHIVRITADCPLIDPQVIDKVIGFYLDNLPKYDVALNTFKLTYPRGMDAEVFSFQALQKAANEATQPEEREHVTVYFYEHPEIFSIGSVENEKDLSRYRWTVDTEDDFKLVSLLLSSLYPEKPHFTLEDLHQEMEHHPEWFLINSHVKQKPLRSIDK